MSTSTINRSSLPPRSEWPSWSPSEVARSVRVARAARRHAEPGYIVSYAAEFLEVDPSEVVGVELAETSHPAGDWLQVFVTIAGEASAAGVWVPGMPARRDPGEVLADDPEGAVLLARRDGIETSLIELDADASPSKIALLCNQLDAAEALLTMRFGEVEPDNDNVVPSTEEYYGVSWSLRFAMRVADLEDRHDGLPLTSDQLAAVVDQIRARAGGQWTGAYLPTSTNRAVIQRTLDVLPGWFAGNGFACPERWDDPVLDPELPPTWHERRVEATMRWLAECPRPVEQ